MRGEAEADGGLDRPSKATAATVNGVFATGSSTPSNYCSLIIIIPAAV